MGTWLDERAKGLGATDAAAVLGQSPYKDAYQVWAEKTGKAEPQFSAAELRRLRRGQRLEQFVLEDFESETGRAFCYPGEVRSLVPGADILRVLRDDNEAVALAVSREHPWLRATPDAFCPEWAPLPDVEEQEERVGMGCVEAKTVSAFRAQDYESGVPIYHQIQGQHQLLVTGLSWVSFPVLIGLEEFRCCDYGAHARFQEHLLEELGQFWQNHVLKDIPPAPSGMERTTKLLKSLHPEDSGRAVRLPEEFALLDRELAEAKAARKAAATRVDEIENLIRATMEDATFAELPDGAGYYTYKSSERKGYFVSPSTVRTLRRVKGRPDRYPSNDVEDATVPSVASALRESLAALRAAEGGAE